MLSRQETELLDCIYQKLPARTLTRYSELTEKRQAETISPSEYEELLRLVPTIESHNAQRVAYLARLAEIRQVTVRELMVQLGISPLHHA